MFLSTGRRLFSGGFRTYRRLFTSGEPNNPKNIYGYFDDRTLGLLTLLVSVPTVRNSALLAYFIKNFIVGRLHMETPQIIESFRNC